MVNPSLVERIQRVGKRHLKHLYFRVAKPVSNPVPVFVLGYGRSGTTMLIDALEHDWRVEVFQENDQRMANNYEIEWDRIDLAVKMCGAPVALFKPILNSFEIARLLDLDNRAFAIWMFRDVDPVVRSSLKKFGSSVATMLRSLTVSDATDSWLGRGMPADVLQELRQLDHSLFTDEDWMALVWWSVNRTLTDSAPAVRRRIRVVKYDAFIRNPGEELREIYEKMHLSPRHEATRWIGKSGSSNVHVLPLAGSVRSLCSSLRTQIEKLYLPTPDATIGVSDSSITLR